MIEIVVNGRPRFADPGCTVAGLLAEVLACSPAEPQNAPHDGNDAERQPTGLAIARNLVVVPRARWNDTVLADGDVVEVLTATQGG